MQGGVCVILYGAGDKPEVSDEVKGYIKDPVEAQKYCDHKNQFADKGYAYFYEVADPIEF